MVPRKGEREGEGEREMQKPYTERPHTHSHSLTHTHNPFVEMAISASQATTCHMIHRFSGKIQLFIAQAIFGSIEFAKSMTLRWSLYSAEIAFIGWPLRQGKTADLLFIVFTRCLIKEIVPVLRPILQNIQSKKTLSFGWALQQLNCVFQWTRAMRNRHTNQMGLHRRFRHTSSF